MHVRATISGCCQKCWVSGLGLLAVSALTLLPAVAIHAAEPPIEGASSGSSGESTIQFAPRREAISTVSTAGWTLIPGGIADSSGRAIYISNASDAAEAIDTASGEGMWENKKAQRPLAVAGNRLVALAPRGQQQAHVLSIVVLDTTNGNLLQQSDPVVFPDWIAVDGGIGLTFSFVSGIEGNQLVMRWQAARQFVGGQNATPEMIAASRKSGTGTARVDLESGQAGVEVDRVPRPFKQPGFGRATDVGDLRFTVTQRSEKVPGGIQLVRRTLQASDKTTGRPLWQQEIAGEVVLSAIPSTAQKSQPATKQSSRR